MTTFMDDLKTKNPKLYEAYKITGIQDRQSLKNMVKALSMFGGFFNTPEDNKRLESAKFILRSKYNA